MRKLTKRMMKKVKIRYIIFGGILLILTFDKDNRTLVRHFFEQKKLNESIENAKRQNKLIKERTYYLENEPSHLERIVRSELSVIAPGEIEYRFQTKE